VTDINKKKIALVTGASRGIGASVAKGLAKKGVHVIILARTLGALEEVDDEIQSSGGSATIVAMDLLDYPAIDRLGANIYERWGKLDILIGNAAILGQLSPIHQYDPKIWDEVIAVNLTANQRLLRSLDPLLRQSKHGRIVFVSSSDIAGGSHPYWGAYAVSKSALETMIKIYATETKKLKLKINIIDPGKTGTALRAAAFPGENKNKNKAPEILVPYFVNLTSEKCTSHGAIIKLES
jgi:NAD(P)-dependent dehydrogenase (short-subunit alcohol dehydrogenase family)